MKNTLYSKLGVAILAAASFIPTSCIEEGEDAVNGKGNNYVRIIASKDAGSEINIAPAPFEAQLSTSTLLEIRRDAISNSDLSEAISVTLAIDNTIVDSYNAYVDSYNDYVDEYNLDLDTDGDGDDDLDPLDHIDHYNTLDGDIYDIPTFTVNFAAGEFVKTIDMTLDPAVPGKLLKFDEKYGLGIKVVEAPSNYVVMQGGTNVMLDIIVKNEWDGEYSSKGYFTHPTPSSSRDIDRDKTLATTGANTVNTELGDLGGSGYNMTLTINPDNTVDITGYIGTAETPIKQDYQVNTYDPETGKFDLKYSYNAAAPRIINEILTRK